jgi:heat shock protein HslJ
MRQMHFSFVLVILVAAITAACTHSVTSPSARPAAPSAAHTIAQLEGAWSLASIQRAGDAKQDRPIDATYTLTFTDGRRLSTRADCNSCRGSFSVDGTTLSAASTLACTRAACPTMAFETAYLSILGGDSQIVVSGSTLTLSSSRGTLQLVRN